MFGQSAHVYKMKESFQSIACVAEKIESLDSQNRALDSEQSNVQPTVSQVHHSTMLLFGLGGFCSSFVSS